jgi:glycosyltransferase involved in cell wall biosynthesis
VPRRRLLVVSHPAVITANQGVYSLLEQMGWEVHLLVPRRWRNQYRPEGFAAEALPELGPRFRAWPVLLKGAPQRHIYLRRPSTLLEAVAPSVVFVEEEPSALVTGQWLSALGRRGVPFGLQQDENLERPLPRIAKEIRRMSLSRAAFVAARSPRAAELAMRHRPGLVAPVIPHTVLTWPPPPPRPPDPDHSLVVGFAGRLIQEKGLLDLADAMKLMRHPVRLRCFGEGPLRDELRARSTSEHPIELVSGIRHTEMDEAYASIDVLALPSRSTPTWAEQFGRVLVEAMSCGRPVVASDSGEIPWVVSQAGGGLLFPEGDVRALAQRLDELAADDRLRTELGQRGIQGVADTFSPQSVAEKMHEALVAAVSRRRRHPR